MLYIKLIKYICVFKIFMKMSLISEKIVFSVLIVFCAVFALIGMVFHSVIAGAGALFCIFCLLCVYDIHIGRKLAKTGALKNSVQNDILLMMFR